MSKEILVPVDGSASSVRAARFAVQLAKSMDVGLRLLYVLPADSVELVGMAGMSRADIEQAGQSSARRAFDAVREGLEAEITASVEEQVAIGDPAEEIIARAEREAPVLIVIGRRGLSRIKTLMLGSVSDKVIRHATCPVTVIS
jgi:nucleotide-binding universal stress UspA family protein